VLRVVISLSSDRIAPCRVEISALASVIDCPLIYSSGNTCRMAGRAARQLPVVGLTQINKRMPAPPDNENERQQT
jgi:hypothetical protein